MRTYYRYLLSGNDPITLLYPDAESFPQRQYDSRCSRPPRRVHPQEVEHRDAEVNHLSSVLEPITNGEPADTAIVTRSSGTGKTCLSQFVTERLREEVLDNLGATIDIHRQSTPHDEFVDRLQQYNGARRVVIIDKVDQLEDPDVIYDLHSLPQFGIICTRNVSPDVIRCECHRGRDDIPVLGYAICDERAYLIDVLQPIIDARDEIKAAIRRERARDDPNEERLEELEGWLGAQKWIFIAYFGYQGFNNAKLGRIECHEAINAFAREILLTAKQRFEAGG